MTTPNTAQKSGSIKAGDIFVLETIAFDDGWEFDRPSCLLSPVIRCFESGANHEQIVEDVLIDAVVSGELVSESFEQQWGWRGYSLANLRRCFRQAMAGQKFPKRGYWSVRETVKIVTDKDGELSWETLSKEESINHRPCHPPNIRL